MGCTSNSSVEVNKIEKNEKNLDEPLEAEELPIIFNKEKKTTNYSSSGSSRIKKINKDPEVINWQINTQNQLIHRIKYGSEKVDATNKIIEEEENEESYDISKEDKLNSIYNNNYNNNYNSNYNNNYNNNYYSNENKKDSNNNSNSDIINNSLEDQNKKEKEKENENEKGHKIKRVIKNNNKNKVKKNIKTNKKADKEINDKNANNKEKLQNKYNSNDINENVNDIENDIANYFSENNKINNNKYNLGYNNENNIENSIENKSIDVISKKSDDNNSDNLKNIKKSNIKNISHKRIKIKSSKEPYLFKTVKNNYGLVSSIKINAQYFLSEYLIPIWFEKETCIKFNSTGKWRIDKNYAYTDSGGMPTSNTIDFNYGALVGRIGLGSPFLIPANDSVYITKNEGPLYLKMSLPKKLNLSPEGTIEVLVYDGIVMPIEEIYKKIGWKQDKMKYAIKEPSDLENNLINTFNNLRMNPVLFYEQNIRDNQNAIWTEEYLKQKYNTNNNSNNNSDLEPLKPNDDCFIILNSAYSNNIDKKIVKQKINLILEEMQECYFNNIKENLKCDNVVNCKLMKKKKPIDVCIQYLLDNKFRNYIFDNKFTSISVKFVENFYEESHLVIVAILK